MAAPSEGMERAAGCNLPPGVMFGTMCRVNFWTKMTTALGLTQIVIGVACMAFYTVAYFTDTLVEHFVTYITGGIVAGGLVSVYIN